MDAIREFLSMGGYAVFVWPAFGVTAAVMIVLLVASVRGLRKERQMLELMEAARPRRRDRATDQAAGQENRTEGPAGSEA